MFFLQKRNIKTNIRLISFPFILCLLLVLIQTLVNHELDKPENKCGCSCVDTNGDGQCEKVCGLEHSTLDQGAWCAVPNPPEWPPLLQVPAPEYRAVSSDVIPFSDLPNESCKRTGSCPVTLLVTGNNQSLGESMTLFPISFNTLILVSEDYRDQYLFENQSYVVLLVVLAGNMFTSSAILNSSSFPDSLANIMAVSHCFLFHCFQFFLLNPFLLYQQSYYLVLFLAYCLGTCT